MDNLHLALQFFLQLAVMPGFRPLFIICSATAKFAAFLKAQPVESWTILRNSIASAANIPNLRRHFPDTVRVLFRREIVDWPSPNGVMRFARFPRTNSI